MTVEFRVISIGTLSRNRLWGEGGRVRTSHATTTLVCDGKRRILVDPSLPAAALAQRYNERTGGSLADVTDVFCTTLRPVHRRCIEALPDADWWVSETELASYRLHLEGLRESAERLDESDMQAVEADLKLLEAFQPAPEQFGRQVQLYPTAGPSPGAAGLLLTPPTSTIVIAGDAALTRDYILAGRVWEGCADTEAALSSLQDVLELADVIVPGHDNLVLAPGRWL
jgi:glyoxylase-like metal-dependent hydrolase (beta-lactamase superfamily II)